MIEILLKLSNTTRYLLLYLNFLQASQVQQKKRVIEYENSYQLEPTCKPSKKDLDQLMSKAISDIPEHYKKTNQFADCHSVRFYCLFFKVA